MDIRVRVSIQKIFKYSNYKSVEKPKYRTEVKRWENEQDYNLR